MSNKQVDYILNTKCMLTEHFGKYPRMEIMDIFKYLFQSSFGCEHLVSNEAVVIEYIKRELSTMPKEYPPCIDKLDGAYSRVHLSCLGDKLTPEELGRIFCLSAKTEAEGRDALCAKLAVAREMIHDGTLPFSLDEFDRLEGEWRELGYPAVRHSETFRREYHPAYRVIADEFVDKMHRDGIL